MNHSKTESFIGKTFNDGKIKVVGVFGKDKKNRTIFKVICEVCSKDPELFPEYFKSTRSNLENGNIPCGCSKSARWTYDQYILRINRANNEKFTINNIVGKFKGNLTKLSCTCSKNHTWTTSIQTLLRGSGCPTCKMTNLQEFNRLDEQVAINRCKTICEKESYRFINFPDGYTKSQTTKICYNCPIHGLQTATYHNFVNLGSRCPECAGNIMKTQEEARLKCKEVCKNKGYDFIDFIGGIYTGALTSYFEYNCSYHGIQKANYNSFINSKSLCPGCAEYGYNPENKGSFYIVKWQNNEKSFIKFGITNRDIITRIEEQSDKTKYLYEIIFKRSWEDGKIAGDLEKSIKNSNMFEFKVVSKDEFEDGYTETIETKDLDKLIEHVRIYLNMVEKESINGQTN